MVETTGDAAGRCFHTPAPGGILSDPGPWKTGQEGVDREIVLTAPSLTSVTFVLL